MVILEFGIWGIGLKIRKFELRFMIGDVYINIPGYFEMAWNNIGFFIDKHHQNRGEGR